MNHQLNWETNELLDHWGCECPFELVDYLSTDENGQACFDVDRLAEDLEEFAKASVPKVEDSFWSSIISYTFSRINFKDMAIYFTEDEL